MPELSADYRVVLFGSAGVGKTSLALRFVKGTFHEAYIPTVEDTFQRVIGCERSVCMLHITDTTGSYQFPAMQRLNISKSDAYVLVYSVACRRSLEELKPLYQQVIAVRGDAEKCPIILVGNKNDIPGREVDDGAAEAKAWRCGFIETSAKNDHNVNELFQDLLKLEKKRNLVLIDDGKQKQKKMLKKCSVM